MKQPEALRLAKEYESLATVGLASSLDKETAAELRRLHEVNQAMLEALKVALDVMSNVDGANDCLRGIDAVEAAIAKREQQ